ncbi:hypothetical protein E4J89_10435 [Arthrobacter sp. CAU 1506]|uniref:hypothetical protein n=1 Tax=Arthrobacter sp. CAU 1506 TaxID=2560052 RepID=UPI0010AC0AA0|nr:hypothetical protein [Arthrobacter sp. CAU 1506]TJY69345.1 hypothetical protein E4J89_10435 [Arthrobacter sp. CAU 1506]
MTTTTRTPHRSVDADHRAAVADDRAYRSESLAGASFSPAPVNESSAFAGVPPVLVSARPATASVSPVPVGMRAPLSPEQAPANAGGVNGNWPAAASTFDRLAAAARWLRSSWHAGAVKDALIEEHRDKVRTQIHLFGGRY